MCTNFGCNIAWRRNSHYLVNYQMVISRLEQRCRYCYGLSATSIEWDTKYSLSWKHGQNVSEPVKSLSDPHQSPFQSQRFGYMLERQQ